MAEVNHKDTTLRLKKNAGHQGSGKLSGLATPRTCYYILLLGELSESPPGRTTWKSAVCFYVNP